METNLNPFRPGILWKLGIKKKNAALNGCISKARANSESKLTFSESSFNFLEKIELFFTRSAHVGVRQGTPAPTTPGAAASGLLG